MSHNSEILGTIHASSVRSENLEARVAELEEAIRVQQALVNKLVFIVSENFSFDGKPTSGSGRITRTTKAFGSLLKRAGERIEGSPEKDES